MAPWNRPNNVSARRRSPIPVLTGLSGEQLRSYDERRYHYVKLLTNWKYNRPVTAYVCYTTSQLVCSTQNVIINKIKI